MEESPTDRPNCESSSCGFAPSAFYVRGIAKCESCREEGGVGVHLLQQKHAESVTFAAVVELRFCTCSAVATVLSRMSYS